MNTQQVGAEMEPGSVSVAGPSKEFEDFIYLVSHDVRNSVRALLELPQWIEEDLEEAGYHVSGGLAENIGLMNTHTRRLDRMLIDLLIYSRIGRMQTVKRLAWADLIDAVLEQLKVPEGYEIIRDLRAKSVKMGETDGTTLISALVSNAIKHHDKDQGKIRIETREEDGTAVLNVRDDGPGIDAAFRDRVFDVMTTLKPRDEVEGSGMGLAHVRKIVSHYGGQIAILSNPEGRGCQIEIRLPTGTN